MIDRPAGTQDHPVGGRSSSSLPAWTKALSVTTVSDEIEAEVVCGLLRSAGIDCGHRVTEATDSAARATFAADGPREILVHENELETARAVLADAESEPS